MKSRRALRRLARPRASPVAASCSLDDLQRVTIQRDRAVDALKRIHEHLGDALLRIREWNLHEAMIQRARRACLRGLDEVAEMGGELAESAAATPEPGPTPGPSTNVAGAA